MKKHTLIILLLSAALALPATPLATPVHADCQCPDLGQDWVIWRDGCQSTIVGECYGLTSYTPIVEGAECPDPRPCRNIGKIGMPTICTKPHPTPQGCAPDTSKCYVATSYCGRCWYSEWPVPIGGEPEIIWRDCEHSLGPMACATADPSAARETPPASRQAP